MNRRDVLKYTALISGAVVGGPLASSLLVGCQPEVVADGNFDLNFFGEQEFVLLKDLIDIILPKTDSPSASEVGVHHMIDHMVAKVYPENQKKQYRDGFDALIDHLEKEDFSNLEGTEKLSTLKALNIEDKVGKAFLDLKQQTIAYYLTTEIIGTQFLNYLPVPGAYEPCISLEEAGNKAWAI